MNIDPLEVLRELVDHFYSSDLEWPYQGGVTLSHIDPELYAKIVLLLPDVVKSK